MLKGQDFARVQTSPFPDPPVAPESVERLRMAGLRRFGTPRLEVERDLAERDALFARLAQPTQTTPPSRRNRDPKKRLRLPRLSRSRRPSRKWRFVMSTHLSSPSANAAKAAQRAAGVRLTARDIRLLVDLYEWAAMLRSHLEALYFSSPQRARARLAALWAAGYVSRGTYPIAPSVTLAQTGEYVYTLGQQALALLPDRSAWTRRPFESNNGGALPSIWPMPWKPCPFAWRF